MKICSNHKKRNILLILGITNVDGLAYDVKDTVFGQEYLLRHHRGYYNVDFSKIDSYDKDELFDSLCASASFPIFFPVLNIKVSKSMICDLSEDYSNESMKLNMTDGGLTDNLPLKPIMDFMKISNRVVMVIPHPDNTRNFVKFANAHNGFPPLSNTFKIVMKLFNVAMYQSIYWDVKTFVKINKEVKKREILIKKMKDVYESFKGEEKKVIEKYMNLIKEPSNEMFDFLKDEKVAVSLDIISPEKPEQYLSGEIINHFGGFFDNRMRKSDFYLGYKNGLTYLKKIGIEMEKILEGNKGMGKLGYREMRNKSYVIILILKTLIVFMYPFRKRFYIFPFYLIIRFFYMILLSIKS